MEKFKLSDIEVGESAVVKWLNCEPGIKRRFMDLGMVGGTQIKCVIGSPRGSIKAYLVRGKVIAIRKCDACKIHVKGAGA